MLSSGKNGPSVDCAELELTIEQVHKILKVNPDESIVFDPQASTSSSSAKVQYLVLQPGNCVEISMLSDACPFAQILIPRVTVIGRPSSLTMSPDTPNSFAIVVKFEFVSPRTRNGNYPELPVPWIRYGRLIVLSSKAVLRRVHVVPLFGDFHRRKGDKTKHFLLNTTADPYFGGADPKSVLMKCRTTSSCLGLLPRPATIPGIVNCPICGASSTWV